MTTKNLVLTTTILFLISLFTLPGFSQAVSDKSGSAQVKTDTDHIHPGGDLTLKIKLNEPLPAGARFEVKLSPVDLNQQFNVSSGEPENKERTEFVLKTKLLDGAPTGEWHISAVYLVLAGTSWSTTTIQTNDLRFVVEGPKVELPTKATATIVGK